MYFWNDRWNEKSHHLATTTIPIIVSGKKYQSLIKYYVIYIMAEILMRNNIFFYGLKMSTQVVFINFKDKIVTLQ